MLDQWLAVEDVPLRVADMTPENQRALANGDWRENLEALRETAVRFAAIIQSVAVAIEAGGAAVLAAAE